MAMKLARVKRKPLDIDFDDPTPIPIKDIRITQPITQTPTDTPIKSRKGPAVVTEAHREKLIASRVEYSAERKERQEKALRIGKYRIYRSDENNINLEKKRTTEANKYVWEIVGYYPDLSSALSGLVNQDISEKDILFSKNLIDDIAKIKEEIIKEIKRHEF
jgi:hypothetical protein